MTTTRRRSGMIATRRTRRRTRSGTTRTTRRTRSATSGRTRRTRSRSTTTSWNQTTTTTTTTRRTRTSWMSSRSSTRQRKSWTRMTMSWKMTRSSRRMNSRNSTMMMTSSTRSSKSLTTSLNCCWNCCYCCCCCCCACTTCAGIWYCMGPSQEPRKACMPCVFWRLSRACTTMSADGRSLGLCAQASFMSLMYPTGAASAWCVCSWGRPGGGTVVSFAFIVTLWMIWTRFIPNQGTSPVSNSHITMPTE
mmetsp:Transcript_15878/g.31327  ORF Transcript_15878/g.31327 Transcript_15878/m.31327 type:complete len:249 (-) Transcript_15878:1180-1926(-)